MDHSDWFDPDRWCALSFPERREQLATTLQGLLSDVLAVRSIIVESGPITREYDLTAVADTDVGRLRTHLWSHARAMIFCDPSVHPANRRQLGPDLAVAEAAGRLRPRLAVPYRLESRGLTFGLSLEDGVERTWTAEHALFRKRTAVTREDRVERAGEMDVRDLLAHFYVGPSLRLVSEAGEPCLLAAADEVEGEMITLCRVCAHWSPGSSANCPACGSPAVDTATASRPPRR
jgi:hypothetical protein